MSASAWVLALAVLLALVGLFRALTYRRTAEIARLQALREAQVQRANMLRPKTAPMSVAADAPPDAAPPDVAHETSSSAPAPAPEPSAPASDPWARTEDEDRLLKTFDPHVLHLCFAPSVDNPDIAGTLPLDLNILQRPASEVVDVVFKELPEARKQLHMWTTGWDGFRVRPANVRYMTAFLPIESNFLRKGSRHNAANYALGESVVPGTVATKAHTSADRGWISKAPHDLARVNVGCRVRAYIADGDGVEIVLSEKLKPYLRLVADAVNVIHNVGGSANPSHAVCRASDAGPPGRFVTFEPPGITCNWVAEADAEVYCRELTNAGADFLCVRIELPGITIAARHG